MDVEIKAVKSMPTVGKMAIKSMQINGEEFTLVRNIAPSHFGTIHGRGVEIEYRGLGRLEGLQL